MRGNTQVTRGPYYPLVAGYEGSVLPPSLSRIPAALALVSCVSFVICSQLAPAAAFADARKTGRVLQFVKGFCSQLLLLLLLDLAPKSKEEEFFVLQKETRRSKKLCSSNAHEKCRTSLKQKKKDLWILLKTGKQNLGLLQNPLRRKMPREEERVY